MVSSHENWPMWWDLKALTVRHGSLPGAQEPPQHRLLTQHLVWGTISTIADTVPVRLSFRDSHVYGSALRCCVKGHPAGMYITDNGQLIKYLSNKQTHVSETHGHNPALTVTQVEKNSREMKSASLPILTLASSWSLFSSKS